MLKYSPVNTVIDKFAQWFWEPLGVEPRPPAPHPAASMSRQSGRPSLSRRPYPRPSLGGRMVRA